MPSSRERQNNALRNLKHLHVGFVEPDCQEEGLVWRVASSACSQAVQGPCPARGQVDILVRTRFHAFRAVMRGEAMVRLCTWGVGGRTTRP
jgi:hypothetical protein